MESVHLLPAIAISALITIYGKYANNRTAIYIFKPLTTILIIFLAILHNSGTNPDYFKFVLAGLAACLVGDFLLIPTNPKYFNFGLAAFLIGQMLYVFAFTSGINSYNFLLTIPYIIFAGIVFILLFPDLSKLVWMVLIYIMAISMMGYLAANRFFVLGTSGAALAFVGSLLFIGSDTILAINRFKQNFPAAEAIILSTYYIAQTLIAFSV